MNPDELRKLAEARTYAGNIVADQASTILSQADEIARLTKALEEIAEATSAEPDAGENYRWDDREGALDYAYSRATQALGGTHD